MFIFPDAEPFNQILGALEFGVKAIFLPFESGNILHRHAEKELNKSNHEIKSSHFRTLRVRSSVSQLKKVLSDGLWKNKNNCFHNLNGKGGISPAFGLTLRSAWPTVMVQRRKSACTGHPITWHQSAAVVLALKKCDV